MNPDLDCLLHRRYRMYVSAMGQWGQFSQEQKLKHVVNSPHCPCKPSVHPNMFDKTLGVLTHNVL